MKDKNIIIRCSEEDIEKLDHLCELTQCYNRSDLIRYMIHYFKKPLDIKELGVYVRDNIRRKWQNS